MALRHGSALAVTRWAAVAVVLRGDDVLLVRRARRAGDPWSGDWAFPGGFRRPDDEDPVATAVRETREEVGLALGAPTGRLPWRWAFDPRDRRPARIHPVLFGAPDGEPRPDPREVAEVRWVARVRLAEVRREWLWIRGRVPWWARVRRVDGARIWGLTGRMLDDLGRG